MCVSCGYTECHQQEILVVFAHLGEFEEEFDQRWPGARARLLAVMLDILRMLKVNKLDTMN